MAPAWATGITQTGGRLGAMVGPLVFAFVAKGESYAWAWSFAATAAACSAVAVLVGRWLMARSATGGRPVNEKGSWG